MLYYLIYFSKSAELMQDHHLQILLKQSRSRNAELQLTGMLLYIEGQKNGTTEGNFMQVLEGKQNEVEYLFNLIKQDNRHYNVTLLKQGKLKKRDFPDWQMGFEKIKDSEHKDGSFQLNDDFLISKSATKTNMAINFLKMFYQMKKD